MYWESIPVIDIHFLVHPPLLWNTLTFIVPINVIPHLPVLGSEEEKLAYFLLPLGHHLTLYQILVLYPHPLPTVRKGARVRSWGYRDLATIHNRMKYKLQELCLNLHNT